MDQSNQNANAPSQGGQFGGMYGQKPDMEYLCAGALFRNRSLHRLTFITDCGAKNEIKTREPIRCRECGHRIMYKKRTKRSACHVGLSIMDWLSNDFCSGSI